jgi:hypothetical protein
MAKKYSNSLDDFNMASVVSGDEATNTSKKEVAKTKKEKTVKVDNSVKLTNSERATTGAARGCKPGYTRHTYVLPQQMIDQIKAVSQFFCCSEVSAAEQLIQKGLDDIRKKHGKKALTLQKTQSLFD